MYSFLTWQLLIVYLLFIWHWTIVVQFHFWKQSGAVIFSGVGERVADSGGDGGGIEYLDGKSTFYCVWVPSHFGISSFKCEGFMVFFSSFCLGFFSLSVWFEFLSFFFPMWLVSYDRSGVTSFREKTSSWETQAGTRMWFMEKEALFRPFRAALCLG